MTRIAVFGGSGVIGRGVLEAASADASIDQIRALQRRDVVPPLPRVSWVKVDDFADLASHRTALEGVDACVFALGISQNLVHGEEYRRITLDFPLEAARRLSEASPRATFVFVSGQGADPTGTSRILFARVKGEAENRLRDVPLGRLVIARPGGVVPATWPRRPQMGERLLFPLVRVLEPIAPGLAIKALDLGKALLRAALDASVPPLLTNRDLRGLAG